MSLRVRLARLLAGRLPQPNPHRLHISLPLPRIWRVAVVKLCPPKVRRVVVALIGRSAAVVRLPWTGLGWAAVSRAELHPLLRATAYRLSQADLLQLCRKRNAPIETGAHSDVPSNLFVADSRALKGRESSSIGDGTKVGPHGGACSIQAGGDAQLRNAGGPGVVTTDRLLPDSTPGDRCPGALQAPAHPMDTPPGAAMSSIASSLEADRPAGASPDSREATGSQPIDGSILVSTTTDNVSPRSPPYAPQFDSVAASGGDVLLEESRASTGPAYRPPRPPRTRRGPLAEHEAVPRSSRLGTESGLRLRVQLVFGRDASSVKSLKLVPERRDGMPSEVQVVGTGGTFHLGEPRDEFYEPVDLPDVGNALLRGVAWHARGAARHWRWTLGGRGLYVLVPGLEFGLSGFISTSRLSLRARHVILATVGYRDQVLAALARAGCEHPAESDETTSGVPPGWLLFRDVTPTRAVPMDDEENILNALCPLHDVEPHFIGGIRLERQTWLLGFPPRIRFTGDISADYQITIDGRAVEPAADGALESAGWDANGQHCLWYGDKTIIYELREMDEHWDAWHAHNFDTGAAICGAGTYSIGGARGYQVRVSTTNPLLVGALPGELFRYRARRSLRNHAVVISAPFAPVWALPADPSHADKRFARIVLLNPAEPRLSVDGTCGKRVVDRALRAWIEAINDAGRKRLLVAGTSEETTGLWQRYRIAAKQLWRKTR